MTISSQFAEVPSEGVTPSASGPHFAQTSLLTGILLLESDLATLSDRARLLTDSSYQVTTARNQSDLFGLRGTTGISLAIVSDALGAAALGVAAQSIRLEWPLAHILILGKPQFLLEDFLYDEALAHRFVESDLLTTIERITHPSANRGSDGGLFILRRSATEADARIPPEGRGDSVNSLRVLPAATGQRQLNRFCAKLILAAEIECGAFMFAAKHLFGEEMTLRAGGLWVEALEEDSSFQCQHTSLRLITIIAACKLADLMGAPIPKDVC
jgi:hypothetical protein